MMSGLYLVSQNVLIIHLCFYIREWYYVTPWRWSR